MKDDHDAASICSCDEVFPDGTTRHTCLDWQVDWPDAGHVPASVLVALDDRMQDARAVLNLGGRKQFVRFLAAVAVAAMEGDRTRYAVQSSVATGGPMTYGPFATWRSAHQFLRDGHAGQPAMITPLVPASKAGRPAYLKK